MKKSTSKIMKAMELLIEVSEESKRGNIGSLCSRAIRVGTARQSGHTEAVGEFLIKRMVKGENWLVVLPNLRLLEAIHGRIQELLSRKGMDNCLSISSISIALGKKKGCVRFVTGGTLEKARGRSFDGVICDDASYFGEVLMREIEAFCGVGGSNRVPLLVLVG